jgi:hypothetical protein
VCTNKSGLMTSEPMPPDVPPIPCPECKGKKGSIDPETGFPKACKRCNGSGLIDAGYDTSDNLSLF